MCSVTQQELNSIHNKQSNLSTLPNIIVPSYTHYAHIQTQENAHTPTHTHTHTHTHIYIYTHIHTNEHTLTRASPPAVHPVPRLAHGCVPVPAIQRQTLRRWSCRELNMSSKLYMCVYIYICVCVYAYIYICVCVMSRLNNINVVRRASPEHVFQIKL